MKKETANRLALWSWTLPLVILLATLIAGIALGYNIGKGGDEGERTATVVAYVAAMSVGGALTSVAGLTMGISALVGRTSRTISAVFGIVLNAFALLSTAL